MATAQEAPTNTQTTTKDPLDELDEFLKRKSESAGSSDMRIIKSGEVWTLVFDERKMKPVVRKFKVNDPDDPTGQKKIDVERELVECTVTWPDGSIAPIDFSPGPASTIRNFTKKGFRKIEVTRKGSGKQTKWEFVPVSNQ